MADFEAWAERSFRHAHCSVNRERLGVVANTRRALDLAFRSSAPFAVLAEEDVVVSADVLEYFSWAAATYAADPDIMIACAHVLSSRDARAGAVVRLPWFSPLTWGTWKVCWEEFIEPGWGVPEGNALGWDAQLRIRLGEAGVRCLFPLRSRALHIGEVSALYRSELSAHMYPSTRSSCYQEDYPPQRWHEVAAGDVDIVV